MPGSGSRGCRGAPCSWRSCWRRSWSGARATRAGRPAHLVHQPRQRRAEDASRRSARRRRTAPTRSPPRSCRTRPTPSASSWCAGWRPDDSSIDLMSLDPPFVAEFANAGFLRPSPTRPTWRQLTDGVLDGPLETAYWDDQLVATPFWANTQLLWYRKSVAEAAGVDPTSPDFTWDQMIDAAESPAARRSASRAAATRATWCGSTRSSRRPAARSSSNAEPGDDADPVDGRARRRRGRRGRRRAGRLGGRPADLSTAGEEEARSLFQGDDGCSWSTGRTSTARPRARSRTGALDQSRRRRHRLGPLPAGRRGEHRARRRSAASTSASATFTTHPDEALAAVKCITSLENNVQYMVESGNPAARAAAYDDPAGARGVPDGRPDPRLDQRRRARARSRRTTATSPRRCSAPGTRRRRAGPTTTPEETDTFMAEVLRGDRLL